MANEFYAKGKQRILQGAINFETANIRAALVRNTYAQNIATDEFYSSVNSHAHSTVQPLVGRTVTNGVFDAVDIVFPAVPAGETYEGVVLYIDNGTLPTAMPLIAYIDNIAGFPVTSTGGDLGVQWDSGANKIFSL